MSFNPVEIELRKPARFAAFNTGLVRLLGDSYRKGALSPSLTYAVGEIGEGGGGGGGLPDVANFVVTYDIESEFANVSWSIPDGNFDGYILECSEAGIDAIVGAEEDARSYNIDFNLYDVDFLTWTIKTFGNETVGNESTYEMYFIASPINVGGEFRTNDSFDDTIYISWNYPVSSAQYVDHWVIKEPSVGYDEIWPDESQGYAEFPVDPSWYNSTLNFEVYAVFAGKQSAPANTGGIFVEETDFGNNPGYLANGFIGIPNVPSPLTGLSTQSLILENDPLFITFNEFSIVQRSGTLSMWIKPDISFTDVSGYSLFTTNGNSDGIHLALTNTGSLLFGSSNTPEEYDPGAGYLIDDNWHNIVFNWSTLDGEGSPLIRFNIFIDGNHDVEDLVVAATQIDPNWGETKIGGGDLYVNENYYGLIDDVRITSDSLGPMKLRPYLLELKLQATVFELFIRLKLRLVVITFTMIQRLTKHHHNKKGRQIASLLHYSNLPPVLNSRSRLTSGSSSSMS